MTTAQHTSRSNRLAEFAIGSKVRLPDGPYGVVTKVEDGDEYGDPVLYVTVNGTLGEATRWVRI
jgi:hypothetical protein